MAGKIPRDAFVPKQKWRSIKEQAAHLGNIESSVIQSSKHNETFAARFQYSMISLWSNNIHPKPSSSLSTDHSTNPNKAYSLNNSQHHCPLHQGIKVKKVQTHASAQHPSPTPSSTPQQQLPTSHYYNNDTLSATSTSYSNIPHRSPYSPGSQTRFRLCFPWAWL